VADPQRKRSFLNYFGTDERPTVERWVNWRDRVWRPLCVSLTRHNVHSDTVTLISFLTLAFFFVPLFALGYYVAAWAVIVVHLVLDGLDGPLARIGGYSSNRGALADIMNDITGMVVIVVVLVHSRFLNGTVGVLYVSSYLYLTILTIGLNILGASYRVILKSKYWMYVAMVVTVHAGVDVLNPFCAASVVYCVIYSAFAYVRLREYLPESMD
jgi:phosphatidylglycerophosphate synthase